MIRSYCLALTASSNGVVVSFSPHWQLQMEAGRTNSVLKGNLRRGGAHVADMWLLPYNRWGNHWAIFIVSFSSQKIVHVDSTQSRPNSLDVAFVQMMIEAVSSKHTGNEREREWAAWQLVVPNTPRQPDIFSCGTRACYCAAVAATGVDCAFEDGDMRDRIRRTIRSVKVCPLNDENRSLFRVTFQLSVSIISFLSVYVIGVQY